MKTERENGTNVELQLDGQPVFNLDHEQAWPMPAGGKWAPVPRTGWPAGLLQDDCRSLSRWFAGRLDAVRRIRG